MCCRHGMYVFRQHLCKQLELHNYSFEIYQSLVNLIVAAVISNSIKALKIILWRKCGAYFRTVSSLTLTVPDRHDKCPEITLKEHLSNFVFISGLIVQKPRMISLNEQWWIKGRKINKWWWKKEVSFYLEHSFVQDSISSGLFLVSLKMYLSFISSRNTKERSTFNVFTLFIKVYKHFYM